MYQYPVVGKRNRGDVNLVELIENCSCVMTCVSARNSWSGTFTRAQEKHRGTATPTVLVLMPNLGRILGSDLYSHSERSRVLVLIPLTSTATHYRKKTVRYLDIKAFNCSSITVSYVQPESRVHTIDEHKRCMTVRFHPELDRVVRYGALVLALYFM